jgi:hypothetical protein
MHTEKCSGNMKNPGPYKKMAPDAVEGMSTGCLVINLNGGPRVFAAHDKHRFLCHTTGHREFSEELSKYKQEKAWSALENQFTIYYRIVEFR